MSVQMHVPRTAEEERLPPIDTEAVRNERRVWKAGELTWCSMCRKDAVEAVCVGVQDRYVCICQDCINEMSAAMASPLASNDKGPER